MDTNSQEKQQLKLRETMLNLNNIQTSANQKQKMPFCQSQGEKL